MSSVDISIILPTFNEKDNIENLIIEIDKYVKGNKEIIVVDDNSPDGTSKIVNKLIQKKKVNNLKLLLRKSEPGLTASLWDGIIKSKGNVIVWMDCDFSHPPKLIPKLLKKIDNGYDIAVASRFIKGGGFKKNIQNKSESILQVGLSRLMNYLIQFLLGGGFKDYSSGFIAIRRQIFDDIKLSGDYGEYFIDLIVRSILLKYKIIEIPFVNLPRKYGESKTGSTIHKLVRRGSKYIIITANLMLLKIRYRLGILNDIRSNTKGSL